MLGIDGKVEEIKKAFYEPKFKSEEDLKPVRIVDAFSSNYNE